MLTSEGKDQKQLKQWVVFVLNKKTPPKGSVVGSYFGNMDWNKVADMVQCLNLFF